MRFNPPPNWPRIPNGWTPPSGWQPDPSWPPPPQGWMLWVNEEDTLFMPAPGAARSRRLAWHKRTATITLLLIFFFPVGLVLLWLRQDWSVRRRGIITGLVAAVVIIGITSPDPPPPTTIQVSPAAGYSSTSPSPSAATAAPASRSAAPSPASSSPRPPASPVVTRTTHIAVAPVQTSVAPERTTTAAQPPQPVQTTAQPQGCYPLTNAGNCYRPGEYCRNADHGVSGIDGNGDPIVCIDNDGWRWERS